MSDLTFSAVFELIHKASFTLEEFWSFILSLVASLTENDYITEIKATLEQLLTPVLAALPIIFMVFALTIAIFGKKLFPVIRFVGFFLIGFLVGVCFLTPPLHNVFAAMPSWLIGLIAGVVFAVASKVVYFILLLAVPFYSLYYLSMSGTALAFTAGNYVISIVIGLVGLVAFLLLRKTVAMLLTSALGGWWFATQLKLVYDYVSLPVFDSNELKATLIVAGAVALVGFLLQLLTRKRY